MIEIIQYEFMQRALIGGFLIGIVSSLIGVFLVLKRLSLLGDAYAHASFGGIALGLAFGINPILTALGFLAAISIGLDKLISKIKLYGESAIALVLSFGMAFALLLISSVNKLDSTIFSYLFGSLLTISYSDILIIIGVLISVLIFYFFSYSTLVYSAFNKEVAQVRNPNTSLVDKIFVILAALTVVISIKAVGILLLSALLVIPALIGMRLGHSFKQTFIIASISSVIGIYIGIFSSYYFDVPVGPSIVMSLLFLFAISLIKITTFINSKTSK